MKLKLEKPIVFFDLETTGLDVARDRIVELCYIRIEPNGNEEAKSMRINPEMHIPEVCSKVHGIYDEDVKDCPTFKEIAPELAKTFSGCDFAGFNSNHFDIPLLAEEFLRAGIDFDFSKCYLVDIQTIFHKMEPRNLSAAFKFYCGKEMTEENVGDGVSWIARAVVHPLISRRLTNTVTTLNVFMICISVSVYSYLGI